MTEEEVDNELRRIAQIVGAKSDELPTVCRLQGGGRPNIMISEDDTLSYEASERGFQIFCYTFTDPDELMYHTFKEIVPRLATEYATTMENAGHNFRKSFFDKKIELMGKVNVAWGKRMEAEQQEENY